MLYWGPCQPKWKSKKGAADETTHHEKGLDEYKGYWWQQQRGWQMEEDIGINVKSKHKMEDLLDHKINKKHDKRQRVPEKKGCMSIKSRYGAR